MKFSAFQMVFACMLMMATAPVAHAGDSALSSVAFSERGVIVDVNSFFTAIGESPLETSLRRVHRRQAVGADFPLADNLLVAAGCSIRLRGAQ